MKRIIETAIENCLVGKEFFVSEMDFQFALANELKKLKGYEVYLGYRAQGVFDKAIHIDIVLMNENNFIPIELKYKTKEATVNTGLEDYTFKYHKAYPDNCKKYLDDIERIESLQDYSNFKEGYAIFLTNDEKYLVLFGKESVGKKNRISMSEFKNKNWKTIEKCGKRDFEYFYLVNQVTKK